MWTELAPFALLCPLLAVATVTDLRSRRISNRLNAIVALLSPASWLLLGLSLGEIGGVLALTIAVFLYYAILFRIGQMGGGDVKLGAALVLWLRPGEVVTYLLATAVVGGIVTLLTIVWHKRGGRPGRPQTPYGLALVAGALLIFAQRYLNHFA